MKKIKKKTLKNTFINVLRNYRLPIILLAIYFISLFVPIISAYTKYPLYFAKCFGTPVEGNNFKGKYYVTPKNNNHKIRFYTSTYFCSEQEARAAGYTPSVGTIEYKQAVDVNRQIRQAESLIRLNEVEYQEARISFPVYYPESTNNGMSYDSLRMLENQNTNYVEYSLRKKGLRVATIFLGNKPSQFDLCTVSESCTLYGVDSEGRSIYKGKSRYSSKDSYNITIGNTFINFYPDSAVWDHVLTDEDISQFFQSLQKSR